MDPIIETLPNLPTWLAGIVLILVVVRFYVPAVVEYYKDKNCEKKCAELNKEVEILRGEQAKMSNEYHKMIGILTLLKKMYPEFEKLEL